MEPVKISLSDYVLSGGGANGESYDHRTDPGIMLKLYHAGKTKQPLDEMNLARKVYELGIPSPEPGDWVVSEDGRYGVRFRRIVGKKSFARAVSQDPEHLQEYAERFANMCLALHATHVDKGDFENVKDRYLRLLEENPFFTTTEKDKIGRFIQDAPDTDTALHGDLQFGNAIFVGDKEYFIDLGDFCYGYPLFDLGMTYMVGNLSDDAFIQEAFHMPRAMSTKFWEAFAAVYFKGVPLKEVNELVRPYSGVKTLIVERDTHCPMYDLRVALDGILS